VTFIFWKGNHTLQKPCSKKFLIYFRDVKIKMAESCSFCSNPTGPDPIDEMIKEKGMAIIQVIDEEAPPVYYSVGNTDIKSDGFEFLIAGLDPELANSTIPILVNLSKEKPELFSKSGALEDVLKIKKNGVVMKAPVYIRLITDDAYDNICGRLISRCSEKVKVFQIFIPDSKGLSFDHPDYDKSLAQVQCPFISDSNF
tara:strand:- start:40720 stop:41316 length:597 start_codon:yes stop_codon:yes gene_type:complete